MASFLIDLGNSNDGPIGMVLRVNAADETEAVEIARKSLRFVAGDSVRLPFPCLPRSRKRLSTSTCT